MYTLLYLSLLQIYMGVVGGNKDVSLTCIAQRDSYVLPSEAHNLVLDVGGGHFSGHSFGKGSVQNNSIELENIGHLHGRLKVH